MKVMNVGNANYANSRQQNFGMQFKSIGDVFKPETITRITEKVAGLKTASGHEAAVTAFPSGAGFLEFAGRLGKCKTYGGISLEPAATLEARTVEKLTSINSLFPKTVAY